MWRPVLAAYMIAIAVPALAAAGNLGMLLTDVDIRFNRAAAALDAELHLTLEECNNGQKSVCNYTINESLAIIATAGGPGQPLEKIVAIYVNHQQEGMREAVLMCELLFAMTIPDLSAKKRVGYVDDLLGQIGKTDAPRVTVDRFRYRLDPAKDKSLFLTVEAVR